MHSTWSVRFGLLFGVVIVAACDYPQPAAAITFTDGSTMMDGTVDGEPVVCGATQCRADQICNAGTCEFACAGSTVPGNYATIQAAVDAIGAVGGTICVGAQSFDEMVTAAPNKDVTIVGASADRSIVQHLRVNASPGNVTLRGIGFANGLELVGSLHVTLTACAARGMTSHAVAFAAGSGADIHIDGCDLQGITGQNIFALQVTDQGLGAWTLTVANSWLHDATVGVNVIANNSNTKKTVVLVNNTFTGNDRAVDVSASALMPVELTYVDNVFSANTLGVKVGPPSSTHRNNAFHGNTTDFAGTAVLGAGDVTADCLLDTGTPPSLHPDSPCRDAGDSSTAPTTDFWGVVRGKKVSIGAVE